MYMSAQQVVQWTPMHEAKNKISFKFRQGLFVHIKCAHVKNCMKENNWFTAKHGLKVACYQSCLQDTMHGP